VATTGRRADQPARIGHHGVGSRLGTDELRSRLVDASRFNPKSVMPPYGRVEGLHAVAPQYRGKPLLTDQEIEDAVAFLLTLK